MIFVAPDRGREGPGDDPEAQYRAAHSRWLTRMFAAPSKLRVLPRIPTAPVRRGGFDALMRTAGGRAWAEAWWAGVLSRDDLDG